MTRVPADASACFPGSVCFWKVSLIILMQQWSQQLVGRRRAIIWFLLFSFMGPQYDLYRGLDGALVNISMLTIGGIIPANKM